MEEAKIAAPAAFTITKTEPDKMLVFGWSNVAVDADGTQITDLQGDVIDPDELEKAAYDHVLNFRSTGERHDPGLRHKGRLVESCVFTKEKQAAIGIPPGIVPEGWWVGYKIDDPEAWEKIKKGEYLSFSVEGKGQRTPIEKARQDYDQYPGYNEWLEENLDATIEEQRAAEAHYRENRSGSLAKSYAEMRKFNPYHDARGRFASKPGGAGKPAASELESKIFGRNAFSEISENETVREIVDDGDYGTYGIRIQGEDTETIGETMTHRSSNWGGVFEDNPELADQVGELDGVSAIDIDMVQYTPQYGGYDGKVAYLLGTNEWADDGYDPGEKVMPEPVVLAKLGYKDGKLVVVESVKDSSDGVSKSYDEMRKFNPYHDARGRFSTANGSASFTYAPGKSKAHDLAIQRAKDKAKSQAGDDKKDKQAAATKKIAGDDNLHEYDTPNKPNKYAPDDPRWGTEPGEYTVYRSGGLDRDVVFTANTYEGSEGYAEAFPESGDMMPRNTGVYSYTVQIQKPFVATTMQEAYKKLFGKDVKLTPSSAQIKKGVTTGDLWVAADNKIAKRLKKDGYDAWLLTSPAPPANKELNLIGNSKNTMKETSRKVPDAVKKKWADEAEIGGFMAHAFSGGKSTGMTIYDWFKTDDYKKGKAEGKWA